MSEDKKMAKMGFSKFAKFGKSVLDKASEISKDATDKLSQAGSEALNKVAQAADDVANSKIVKDATGAISQAGSDAISKVSQVADDVANSKIVKDATDAVSQAGSDAINKVTQVVDDVANTKIVKDATDAISQVASDVANTQIVKDAGEVVSKYGGAAADFTTQLGKDATGVTAYHSRKEAMSIKESASAKYESYQKRVEDSRVHLNERLCAFGVKRCQQLTETMGVFLDYLERMSQRFKEKEFDIPSSCDLTPYELKEMGEVNMQATDVVKTVATGGVAAAGAASVAATGVTAAVTAWASASTGTAIASLHGAAATNAVLAFLGGGSLASGGGGVAAGTAVLGGIAASAAAGAGLLVAGYMASRHFKHKLVEAKEYEAEVEKSCAQMDLACDFMGQVEKRIEEMEDVTDKLSIRAKECLRKLEPILTDFSLNHPFQMKIFQENALVMKSLSELAQTPILGDDGGLSDAGAQIMVKSQKLLNTNL